MPANPPTLPQFQLSAGLPSEPGRDKPRRNPRRAPRSGLAPWAVTGGVGVSQDHLFGAAEPETIETLVRLRL